MQAGMNSMAVNADTPKLFLDPSVAENHCRTCWSELYGTQRYGLFSVQAVQSNLCWRACQGVVVISEYGLPDSICKRCYRKLVKLTNEISQIKHEASGRYRRILQETRFKVYHERLLTASSLYTTSTQRYK